MSSNKDGCACSSNIDDFQKVDWHVMIVDEAHRLKNRRTRFHKAANAIKTKLRYGLTGTAMQNDYDELWALMHWAVPFSLGEYEAFKHDYIVPMRLGQQSTAAEHIHAKVSITLPHGKCDPFCRISDAAY